MSDRKSARVPEGRPLGLGAASARSGVPVQKGAIGRGNGGVQLSAEKTAAKIREGRLDPDVRAFAINTIRDAGNPKDVRDRAQALLDGVHREAIWIDDPLHSEYVQAPRYTLCLDKKICFHGGDCFPKGTLLLKDDGRPHTRGTMVPIEEVRAGDRIWGKDAWTRVVAVADKGVLRVTEIDVEWWDHEPLPGHADDVACVRLTSDHHVFVVKEDGTEERKRVSELRPRLDRLITPAIHPNTHELIERAPWVGKVRPNTVEEPCFDLQTEDHYVYLAEHEITVSNCDDLVCAYCSMAASIGMQVRLVYQAFYDSDVYSHVACAVWRPDPSGGMSHPGDWLIVDPTPPPDWKPGRYLKVGETMNGVTKTAWVDPWDVLVNAIESGAQAGDYVGVGRAHPIMSIDSTSLLGLVASGQVSVEEANQLVADGIGVIGAPKVESAEPPLPEAPAPALLGAGEAPAPSDVTFGQAIGVIADGLAQLRALCNPRELIILQIGLHASHAEESIAHGAPERAKAHGKMLEELIAQLKQTGTP